jgi:hypothetical protein
MLLPTSVECWECFDTSVDSVMDYACSQNIARTFETMTSSWRDQTLPPWGSGGSGGLKDFEGWGLGGGV